MCFFIQNHKHGSPDKYEHKNSESDDEILDGIDPVEWFDGTFKKKRTLRNLIKAVI